MAERELDFLLEPCRAGYESPFRADPNLFWTE